MTHACICGEVVGVVPPDVWPSRGLSRGESTTFCYAGKLSWLRTMYYHPTTVSYIGARKQTLLCSSPVNVRSPAKLPLSLQHDAAFKQDSFNVCHYDAVAGTCERQTQLA